MESDRCRRGQEKIQEIHSRTGESIIEELKDVAPDLVRYIIEFPYGDIYSRGVLSMKERAIATVAALTAMGNVLPILKAHIHVALNMGCTRQEVMEIIIQMAVFAGFPVAVKAGLAAKEVFTERDQDGKLN